MKPFLQKIAKTILLLFVICNLQTVFAQAPQKMSYQAVIRDASNILIANTPVGIRISILQTSSTGTAVFVETHTPTTNTNGLATLEIGGGTPVSGNFSSINWANGPHFIKTETDPVGGTNYTISGTSQLLSVPFALFAANSSSASLPVGNAVGDMLMWNGTQWQPKTFNYYYADRDGDTYGDHFSQIYSSFQPDRFVTNDCDDDDTDIGAGGGQLSIWYKDADADGFAGDPDSNNEKLSCYKPAGYTDILGDCNDSNALVYPNAPEICDGIDNDCDGQIDEKITVYADSDNDTFGNPNSSIQTCMPIPTGYVTNNTDCNDTSNLAHPGASEICDGIDNNCDGQIDEKTTFYLDNDHDNYGDSNNSIKACYPIPTGYVIDGSDCNDNEYYANPGVPGEICDGIDNNCDGQIDEGQTYIFTDNDGDGFGDANNPIPWNCANPIPPDMVNKAGDCDDWNPSIHRGAVEICDGLDNDCNGLIDDNVTTLTTFYVDLDQDGYGDLNTTTTAIGCTPPNGFAINSSDCNDTNPNINPIAQELCNGIDDNCNGLIDEGESPDGSIYYIDMDGDGFGDALNIQTMKLCNPTPGWSLEATDCNDQDPTIYPGAPEICDGLDNDCNGITDEGLPTTTWYFDSDRDGYGFAPIDSCFQYENYVAAGGDCDDYNASVFPNASEICDGLDNDCNGMIDDNPTDGRIWYQDADGDNFGNPSVQVVACNGLNGYVSDNTDCDDTDAQINPWIAEICDGKDNNCDGIIDNDANDATKWYQDADGDSFGNTLSAIYACSQPTGYVANSTDCNDNFNFIYPGAPELCDGLDNDCNGLIDDGATFITSYKDADADGYGNPSMPNTGCTIPAGYSVTSGDCDDSNAAIHPGAIEICGNGIDENCDTILAPVINYYLDADGDGYGNPSITVSGCSAPAGYVANNTDCNDTNAQINPSISEICDGLDNNCDGIVDNNPTNGTIWYQDADGDGYGNPSITVSGCFSPAGFVANNTDCNDTNAQINPLISEICDGLDNDCNGLIDDGATFITSYKDADADGYGNPSMPNTGCTIPAGYSATSGDCDDSNAAIHPGAIEICGNGIDENCDTILAPVINYYLDADGDGYGNPSITVSGCSAPAGFVANNTDCNDANAQINPSISEICDGLDNNCDGIVDNNPTNGTIWYQDADGDGYGVTSLSVTSCSAHVGYSAIGGDCDDTRFDVHPGAIEICGNGIDENCNGQIDEAGCQ